MIPISLSIQGLYSYQEKQFIDFSKMIDAELFGIFGATGSGKSSILDAIFLTLYGKCERLEGRIAGGTNYNMMNLKSNKLWLDFEFMDGNKDRFKFTLEAKRRKKKFEEIESLNRSFYRWDNHQWVPISNPDIEEIIGLNYENFRRTIIIPQGKFQEFIHLKSTARENMLTDIFGLHKFDLSENTKILLRRNREDIEKLHALHLQYEKVTKDYIQEKIDEKEKLIQERQKLERQLTQVRAELSKLELLKNQIERKQNLELRLQELLKQKEDIQGRRKRLDEYIFCLDRFKSSISEHQNLSRQLKDVDHRIERQREDLQSSNKELKARGPVLKHAEQVYQQRDSLKKKAEEYDLILKIKDIHINVQGKEDRITKARKHLQQLSVNIEATDKEIISSERQQEEIQDQLVDEVELREVGNWFYEKNSLQQELDFILQNEQKIQRSIEEAKSEKKKILEASSIDSRQHELPVQKVIQLLEEEKNSLDVKEEKLKKELQEIQLNKELYSLSQNLAEGEACPLCGNHHHPQPRHLHSASTDTRKVERELQEANRTRLQLTDALPKLNHLLSQSKKIQQERQEVIQAKEKVASKIAQHQTHFIWKDYQSEDPDLIKEKIKQRENQKKKIEGIRLKIKGLYESQKEQQSKRQLYEKKLEEIQQESSELIGQLHAVKNQLTILTLNNEIEKEEHELRSLKHQALKEYNGAADTFEQIQSQVRTMEKEINILEGKLHAEKQQRQEVLSSLAKLSQKLENEIKKGGFQSLQQVSEILDQSIHIDTEKEIIRAYEQNLTECQTSLKDVEEDIGDKSFDENHFLTRKKDELELTDLLDEKKQNIGVLSGTIAQLEADLQKKKELEQKMEKAENRKGNLQLMERLFKGKGFVRHVSTKHLENLCAAANQRFIKLTGNALSLEVDAENNFFVRDLMNEGRRRSIKTLSGGQTFQAALCLALALSDQVQKQVQADQNFFFLDEGFGSQDKNSLQIIFQTLKSLRKEKRVVGVISHVEDLQEEIDTHLRISLDPQRGSLIRSSWEI